MLIRAPRREVGFSLIEISIVLAILALVLTFGVPSFVEWSQNTQIRATTESIQSGLQFARSEAVRRNTGIEFKLSNNMGTAGGTGWTVAPVSSPNNPIQSKPDRESSSRIVVTSTPSGADMITFDGTGRAWTNKAGKNNDGTDFLTRVNVDSSGIDASKTRELSIMIDAVGGRIRMCDPNVSTTGDPRKCS